MKKLKELKRIVHKNLPEILELKKGCEFNFYYQGLNRQHKLTYTLVFIESDDDNKEMFFYYNDDEIDLKNINFPKLFALSDLLQEDKFVKYEILGRPITISDILRVIHKRNVEVELSVCKTMLIGHYNETGYCIYCRWNLEETLDNQSQETIDNLLSILR